MVRKKCAHFFSKLFARNVYVIMVKRQLEIPNSSSKMTKLSAFGFSSGANDNSVSQPVSPKSQKNASTLVSATPSSPSTRKFMDTWKFNRPWLRYDPNSKLMFCDICVSAQVVNSFTSGCSVMKKESVTKHESKKGPNSHFLAQTTNQQMTSMEVVKTNAINKSRDAVISAMINVYFAAKNDLANAVVPKLHKLCITQGATQLKDLQVDKHTNYTHHSSTKEYQQSLAEVVVDELVSEVGESGVYSIMLDESTDVSFSQNVVVYVRYLASVGGKVTPVTRFLGIKQLSVANAESIFSELVSLLGSFNFKLDKLVGVSTDGASVMVGCKSGVVTRLKQVTSGLLATHCIAHRLALGTGAAADKIRYLVKFQDILNSMFKYFANSPKNMSKLQAIQAVLQSSQTRLQQVFHTRWLSFEGSVQAVVDNYPSLVSVFIEDNSAKALVMHKPITTYKFLYTAHFLSDVLRHLAILCKTYQRSDIDFTEVNPLLLSTVEVLEGLKSESGPNTSLFLSQVPAQPILDSMGLCTFQYKGHTIRDSAQQRSESSSACSQFVSIVIDNLRSRFTEEGDASVLGALTKLFDPSLYSQSESDNSILSEVSSVVSSYLSSCGLGDISVVSQELVGFISYASVQVSRSPKLFSSVKDLVQLAVRSSTTYPAVSVAAERLLVSPVSTVDCERGFSRMNLIKTDVRNKLAINTLENLMRVSLHDSDETTFQFNKAFDKWAAVKSRRILM